MFMLEKSRYDRLVLLNTLRSINWNYGRGEVVDYLVNPDSTGVATIYYGWVPASIKPMREERRFTVIGDRVRFRGVTRKIGYTSK